MSRLRASFLYPSLAAAGTLAGALALASCSDDKTSTAPQIAPPAAIRSSSVTPALVKNVMSGVTVYSLISSDDKIAGSPGYTFGGTADGAGVLRNADGTFTLVVNNEDNFAVSRLTLDANFAPIKGEYLLNSDVGRWRLCSATLATPQIHGFGPVFLTAGESQSTSDPMIHAVDPTGAINNDKLLPAFGKSGAEQALPLPKEAFAGKTIVLIGDDDSGAQGGQVAMYVGNGIGDLDNGSLYVMARADGTTKERSMVTGQSYQVVFKKIDNQKDLSYAQVNTRVTELGAIAFGRVEDLDYRKGAGHEREIYFNVTGQERSGVNADFSRTRKGRVYRLVLDATDPTKGTLEVVLDGDDVSGPAKAFQDPDNIVATENYLYISEDPNGYGDETHDSYLWQYNLATKELKVVFELDQHRNDPKYGGPSALGSWENSGMIDISEQTGAPGTFLIGVQAHTWKDPKFAGVDGGSVTKTFSEGSQLLVLSGLPR